MYRIYTKKFCPWCSLAEHELDSRNIPYNKLDVIEYSDEYKTVPIIYKDDRYVGGYAELQYELMAI